MGLFSKSSTSNVKFQELEKLYCSAMSPHLNRKELLAAIQAFKSHSASFSEIEKAELYKYILKNSKRNKGIHSFDHSIFGFFFESDKDTILEKIEGRVIAKEKNILKAIKREEEFSNIEEILPRISSNSLTRHRLSEIPEIKIQNITKSFNAESKLMDFVVLDLETTGLSPSKNRIVQIAALRYENFEPTECFVSLVNPLVHIPEEASAINGIHDEDVDHAPKLDAISDSILEFVGKSPIVGYNVSFDLSFLYCSGIDLISKRKIYDAKVLAKKLYKGDINYYSLENVLSYNGIKISNLHDAKVDCYATGLVFLEMIKNITN